MSGGNTVGRIVGQSPPSEGEPEESNPAQKLMELFQQGKELFDQIKQLVETFKKPEGADGPAGHAPEGGDGAPDEEARRRREREHAPIETPAALRDRLTEIGATLQPTPGSMEGRPRADQVATQRITQDLVHLVRQVSGEPGRPVERGAIDAAVQTAQQLVAGAPSRPQARQAVDNAMTMANMAGVNKPAMEVLQKVMGAIQQIQGIVKSVQGIMKTLFGDGAFIKQGEGDE